MPSCLRKTLCRLLLALTWLLVLRADSSAADPTRYDQRLILKEHERAVTSVTFSPDGKQVFSSSSDGTIRRWDVSTGLELQKLSVPAGYMAMQVFNLAEGRFALSLSVPEKLEYYKPDYRSIVQLWDLETGQERRRLQGEIVGRIAIAPDGLSFVAASRGSGTTAAGTPPTVVGLWEIETGKLMREVPGRFSEPLINGVTDFAFAASGKEILVATPSTVLVWDLKNDMLFELARERVPGNTATYISGGRIALSPDERFLFSRNGEMLSVRDKNSFRPIAWSNEKSRCLAISPDSRFGVLGGIGTIGIVDLNQAVKSTKARQKASTSTMPIQILYPEANGQDPGTLDVCFSPDGNLFAVALGKCISIWETEAGVEIARCGGWHAWTIWDAACGDRKLQVGFLDHSVLLQTGTDQKPIRLEGHTAPVICVALSPDCRYAFSAGLDRTVRIWDLETGKPVHVLSGHRTGIIRLTVSPNGRVLHSVGLDRVHHLWDVDQGVELRQMQGRSHPFESICSLSPDGSKLLTTDIPGTAYLWNLESGTLIRKFDLDGPKIIGMAFAPDSDQLLFKGGNKRAYLVDAATGRSLGMKGLSSPWVQTAWSTMPAVVSWYTSGGSQTIIIPR